MDLSIIKDLSKKTGISLKRLADEVEMPDEILFRCIRDNSISANALERIAEVLKVPINVFFNENVDNSQENDKGIIKELYLLENFIRKIVKEENAILLNKITHFEKTSNIRADEKPEIISVKLNVAVENLRKEGFSYREIGKELGISSSKAYRVSKAYSETIEVEKEKYKQL